MLAFGVAGFFAKLEAAAGFFEKLERLALADVTMMADSAAERLLWVARARPSG